MHPCQSSLCLLAPPGSLPLGDGVPCLALPCASLDHSSPAPSSLPAWLALLPLPQKPYQDKAAKDKERYEKEKVSCTLFSFGCASLGCLARWLCERQFGDGTTADPSRLPIPNRPSSRRVRSEEGWLAQPHRPQQPQQHSMLAAGPWRSDCAGVLSSHLVCTSLDVISHDT